MEKLPLLIFGISQVLEPMEEFMDVLLASVAAIGITLGVDIWITKIRTRKEGDEAYSTINK